MSKTSIWWAGKRRQVPGKQRSRRCGIRQNHLDGFPTNRDLRISDEVDSLACHRLTQTRSLRPLLLRE